MLGMAITSVWTAVRVQLADCCYGMACSWCMDVLTRRRQLPVTNSAGVVYPPSLRVRSFVVFRGVALGNQPPDLRPDECIYDHRHLAVGITRPVDSLPRLFRDIVGP
jgi:hypothetical protein